MCTEETNRDKEQTGGRKKEDIKVMLRKAVAVVDINSDVLEISAIK